MKKEKQEPKTLKDIQHQFSEEIETFKDSIPYNCWRGFGPFEEFFHISDNQIRLTQDGDYMSRKEWVEAFEFWLKQMKGLDE